MFGDMNGGGVGGGPWGSREPWRPPYDPTIWGGGGGGYPTSGSSSSAPQTTTETSQSKTDATKQVSTGGALFVLGLFVVSVGCVVWVILTLFGS